MPATLFFVLRIAGYVTSSMRDLLRGVQMRDAPGCMALQFETT